MRYISADDYIEKVQKELNLPKWAIALAGLRYREDLTQRQLGEIVGVSQACISQMERGLRPISEDVAKRLSKALNADYRKFLAEINEQTLKALKDAEVGQNVRCYKDFEEFRSSLE